MRRTPRRFRQQPTLLRPWPTRRTLMRFRRLQLLLLRLTPLQL
jgi:hypothetical protein